MAYNRAPRLGLPLNTQTASHVSPNYYEVNYDGYCNCRGTNWAPFLSCSDRKTAAVNNTPGPDAYFPKINQKIIGGASVRYTEPRFKDLKNLSPPSNRYDPYHLTQELEEEEEYPFRLKGYMYHCNVPYTILGYAPSIPKPRHEGYDFVEGGILVESSKPDPDTTLGPAFYHVNFNTFCSCYRGCFWSRDTSQRKTVVQTDSPGVGTYDVNPKPNQLEKYLNKLRDRRKRAACILRYVDELQATARRNNYPAPNQYFAGDVKCVRVERKIVPKRLKVVRKCQREPDPKPGPSDYMDPRTAFDYLVKPSFVKGLNAFLTRAPRFSQARRDKIPAPNRYRIKSFLEANCMKPSPYAIRDKVAFNTSVPKKLYFLPPDYPVIVKKKPCKCSAVPPSPEPATPKVNPTYPFASRTERFKSYEKDYLASCASYSIHPGFKFSNESRSFRRARRPNFLSTEKRFARVTNFAVSEDNSYIPAPVYDWKYIPQKANNTGMITYRGERFRVKPSNIPGPLEYSIHPTYSSSVKKPSFNVFLTDIVEYNPFQLYRIKLNPRLRLGKEERESVRFASECSSIEPINLEFSKPDESREKKWKKNYTPKSLNKIVSEGQRFN